MTELYDDMSELIYITNPHTYELLYVNKAGRKTFHIDEIDQKKCYEVFQGLSAPCPFCTTPFLKKGETYSWEKENPISGRCYILKDSLIDWNGIDARIEIALDITEQMIEKRKLEIALDGEKMVLQCIRQLHQATNLQTGVSNMLKQIGEDLFADRAYIFYIQDNRMTNTYEWCAPGITTQKNLLQDMDISVMARWNDFFQRDECVIIENLSDLQEISPDEYRVLSLQNVTSLAAAPLKKGDELIGFLGVDNPSVEKIQNIASLFNTLRYFLMTAITRMLDEQQLEFLSYLDSLTGLYNRNRYIQDIDLLKTTKQQTLGVLFMDLNGLKKINDTGGHAAGDTALITCAQELLNAFPDAMLYRIGGDEFVALAPSVSRSTFYHQVKQFHDNFRRNDKYKVAVGTQWSDNSLELERMIQDADSDMYHDKRLFYQNCDKNSPFYKLDENHTGFQEHMLLKEYHMLMGSLHISVSKHLVQKNFLVIWANDYFFEMLGYTREEFSEIFHNSCEEYFKNDMEEYERLVQLIMNAFSSGQPSYESLLHLPQKSGNYIWISIVGTFTDERINGIPVIYTVFTNVSKLIQIQKEQMLTYDSLPGFVAKIQIAEDGPRLLYGNKQFSSFFGKQQNGKVNPVLLKNLRKNWKIIKKHYSQLWGGESVNFHVTGEDIHGKTAYFQIFARCVERIKKDPIYLIIFIDITELTNQQEQLRKLAFVDPITDGKNRTSFVMDAGEAVSAAPANTYALVSIDIQKFKVVNDLFGIEAGDRTLHYVYHKMEQQLSDEEYAARLSSDTFNLLVKNDTPENLEARLKKLAKDINSFNDDLTQKYFLVLAAGIYPIDTPLLPMTQIQDRANTARKKTKGCSGTSLCICQFYSNQDRLLMQREKEIENRMQDALKNREFLVYIQPKQSLTTHEVVGGEALVRWLEPQHGLMPPDDFIPLFEKNGFIIEIDLYVFESVCAMLRSWIDTGRTPIPISVNMSRVHLLNQNFLEQYEVIRKKYSISPEFLEIEITETLVFENPDLLSSVIDKIHSHGYQCSMDDFGSGYSSLNVLKSIRVDTLKLDRAFFSSGQFDNPWEAAIIDVVVNLAKRLNMTTVAEGVETCQQAEFLKSAGCDMLQGYLFSRPVPIPDFEKLLFET